MTRRQRRMMMVVAAAAAASVLVVLGTQVFRQNLMYFYSASEVVSGAVPAEARIRLGGLVVPGSVQRETASLLVEFQLADCDAAVGVRYEGILPDLFREGQGIVATGQLREGVFIADEVLAKHDENYIPPELAERLGDAKTGHSCAPFKSLEKT